MSELSNPLFDNERDFLERQKDEYRNALMGDVDNIKAQSQEIGKKVAMAGGVLLAGYLLKRMIGGSSKKKAKKPKKKTRSHDAAGVPVMAGVSDYNSLVHEHEDEYTLSSERMPHAQHNTHEAENESKGMLSSSVVKVITSQAAALLMMYITKKVSDHLNSISENDDIAARPVEEVTVVETTEIIVPKEDAI
ncbi:hypothetical protein [uncultured Pontibacter sp.]|uniref:hypothetical protein n=1 Tax=uncultured Pontibacter sp. TaxID=453356 RepID=UPI00260D58EB|nr:hypothetical protein [uncultured Pontibacter sp.]